MDKLLEFGRKTWFMVRVLSGYEERRIRAYRLQLQKRIEKAQARKEELRRIPEQAILAEVRRMVEQMQALNHQLEETEAAIEEYFKPIDKNAEIIMSMQLEKEEKQMKEMLKAMHEQAMLQRELAAKKVVDSDAIHPTQQMTSTPSNQEQAKES
ncbi:uncharacterized protein LOC103701273 [Phoenix dactylifera]|uniref:Uncharacterized protein LOC103701273 n=1 Tax=Phoenix dactylifera TaxID=42345 RepID=A0A8B7BME3_PHODC|nr:uncharacterized protein LOC103701273 [Phoenix dactylifera]XP_008781503.1 uncharacterized protein LOC103701273 [Phoenix dactylifera]